MIKFIVLVVVVLLALLLLRMARQRRVAALPVPPAVTPGNGVPGHYLGTTTRHGDLHRRGPAVLHRGSDGLLLARAGAAPLWIPTAVLHDVRTDPGGLLVVRWRLGRDLVDTSFRTTRRQP